MSNTFNKTLFGIILLPACIISIYIVLALSVDNSLSSDDIIAIKSIGVELECKKTDGQFDRELTCISAIQRAVQSIKDERCAMASEIIEPLEFLKRNYGCCYDRARFIEKAARYFGFETRHVFLIQPAYGISATNMLPLKQASHAASEILTSKGWIGVDSNRSFILINSGQEPVTYREAINVIEKYPMMHPREFFTKDIDIIYGLYSRHGNFHGRNFPGPEYVFSELSWNWR